MKIHTELNMPFNDVGLGIDMVGYFIDLSDASIASRKRHSLLEAGYTVGDNNVPVSELHVSSIQSISVSSWLSALNTLLKFASLSVEFMPQKRESVREKTLLVLSKLLLLARLNSAYNYFLERLPSHKRLELYVNLEIGPIIESACEEYDNIISTGELRKVFKRIVDEYKGRWHLIITQWARYIEHCIFHDPRTRLPVKNHSKFLFMTLDTSNNDQPVGYNWEEMVDVYAKNNASFDKKNYGLNFAPHMFELLDDDRCTVVAIDASTKTKPRIVAYANFTSWVIDKKIQFEESIDISEFHDPNVKSFVEQMHKSRRSPERKDCGFDLLILEGLSVDVSYRSTPHLVRVLLLHLLEFVRQSRTTLGLKMIGSESAAPATRSVLSSLGFSHWNPESAFDWIVATWDDYLKKLTHEYEESSGTPSKLLKLRLLLKELNNYKMRYLAHRPGDAISLMINQIILQYEQLDEIHDASFMQSALTQTQRQLSRIKEKIEDDDTLKKMRRKLSRFLGSHSLDTFLFVGEDATGQKIDPFQASENLARQYREGLITVGVNSGEVQIETITNINVHSDRLPKRDEEEEWIPEDAIVTLYDQWEAIERAYGKTKIVAPLLPRVPLNGFVPSESEKKRETRSIKHEIDALNRVEKNHFDQAKLLKSQLEDLRERRGDLHLWNDADSSSLDDSTSESSSE